MAAVIATLVCPVCWQAIWENPHAPVCLAHTDRLGRACPMSGQPFGATTLNAHLAEITL